MKRRRTFLSDSAAARWSAVYLRFLLILALLADLIAYNKPYYAVYQGNSYFPILNDYLAYFSLYQWKPELINAQWSELALESAFWPPVRYLPTDIDYANAQAVSPLGSQILGHWSRRHWLGTDELGRDVLSGLIHGARISLLVATGATGVAAIIGVVLGLAAGYYGDTYLRMKLHTLLGGLLGAFLGWYYAFLLGSYTIAEALATGIGSFMLQILLRSSILLLFILLGVRLAGVWKNQHKIITIPVDLLISRLIEIQSSLPTLLLLFTVAALAKPSIWLVISIIGLTGWTGIARLLRAEVLKVRAADYIQAVEAMGLSPLRILWRHILPNAVGPVLIAIAFSVGGAILAESGLSFLGVGLPVDIVTWGSLLAGARQSTDAWWLAVFPGCAIFLTVLSCNLLGETLQRQLEPGTQQK